MIDLPVVVDWVSVNPTGRVDIRIEATIDLVTAAPQIVQMSFDAPAGLDLSQLQRDFRWASPLDVVTMLMPAMLEKGIDPFEEDLPLTGFPAVAGAPTRQHRALSQEFLAVIAREYTVRGRGYATSLANEYRVTPRTVVSWVEKTRDRSLLTRPPRRGAVGGAVTRDH